MQCSTPECCELNWKQNRYKSAVQYWIERALPTWHQADNKICHDLVLSVFWLAGIKQRFAYTTDDAAAATSAIARPFCPPLHQAQDTFGRRCLKVGLPCIYQQEMGRRKKRSKPSWLPICPSPQHKQMHARIPQPRIAPVPFGIHSAPKPRCTPHQPPPAGRRALPQ